MSIARTRVTPSTYEETQSILGTVARLFRPQRSQSAHINQDDGGDVEVDVPGDSIVPHTHERKGGNKTKNFKNLDMMNAAEGRPCSVCLGKGPWRRSVKIGERGSLESSRQRCVGLVGPARFTPGVGYTLVVWASLISFLRLPFSHV